MIYFILVNGILQPLSGRLADLDIPTPQPQGLKEIPGDDPAHQFQAPGPTDVRGICPTLNALANHGYISRDGVSSTSLNPSYNTNIPRSRHLLRRRMQSRQAMALTTLSPCSFLHSVCLLAVTLCLASTALAALMIACQTLLARPLAWTSTACSRLTEASHEKTCTLATTLISSSNGGTSMCLPPQSMGGLFGIQTQAADNVRVFARVLCSRKC